MKWLLPFLAGGTILGAGTVAVDSQIDPYQSKADRYEISDSSVIEDAGEVKTEVLKNEPAVVFKKWGGEAEMKVRYMGIDPATPGSRQFLTNRVEWKDSKKPTEEVHAYPLEKGEGMEDGGIVFELVLLAKPDTNRFCYALEGAEQFDWFKQPPLTQEEIDGGAFRPDNVVNSYAVYHRTKANHQEGQTNYATGKVFHRYRAQATDASGDKVWGDSEYSNGEICDFIPQSWLDNAVYPVKL